MNQLSFEIITPIDFFGKLIEDHREYAGDLLSSRRAINCAMSAWHLLDWIYWEYYHVSMEKRELMDKVQRECPAFIILQDITNGSKHYRITYYTSRVASTEHHRGAFSSGFSRGFDISTLEVIKTDGTRHFYEDIINEAIVYWRLFFKNELNIELPAH